MISSVVISTASTMRFKSWTYIVFMLIFHCHIANCFRNFALNKRAYQSSTENYNNFDWTADKAVDGNIDGKYPGGSRTCSETELRMGNHTWEVDIGFLIIVKSITVYERSDGTDQLSGFQVFIGNYCKPWIANQPLMKASSGHFQHLFRASDSLARFISVIRQNKATLTICEVVVHGECLDGMYSAFCDRTCGKCFDGQPCNKDTGECLRGCEPGWTGILCDKGFRNFALNKRAYQSSTENYNNFDWTADKAVDGNTDGNNPDASRTCSETDVRMGNHTWEVDIGFLIIVKTITIYERSDGTDQLSGFQVFIRKFSKGWSTNQLVMKASSGHFQHLFRASDSLARFISVIRQNKATLTICEVVVHGECLDGMYSAFCDRTCGKCFDGQPCNKDTGECLRGCEPGWTGILCDKGFRNFALNKRAYQSSTENYNNFDWTADKAVDGNTDGNNPDASRTCSETDVRMGNHTWEVDIGFLIIVKTITIYERSDGTDQLSGFQVFIGNFSKEWSTNQLVMKASSGHFQHLFRASDSLARFISVIRQNKATLTICEVVVHGECLDGMYSAFCDRTCGKCFDGQPCNKDTGECLRGCEPGWTGILCDNDPSETLTQTFSMFDATVIVGSAVGMFTVSVIINIITIAVLKKRRKKDTSDNAMQMNEICISSRTAPRERAHENRTATRDDNAHEVIQITEAEYEVLQDHRRMESSTYFTPNST